MQQQNNIDPMAFGNPRQQGRFSVFARRVVDYVFRRLGYLRAPVVSRSDLNAWSCLFSELEWLYETLVDDQSRTMLVKTIAYRILGPKHVRLPLSTPQYWADRKNLGALGSDVDTLAVKSMDWMLKRTTLNSIGYPIELYTTSPAIMTQFVLQQYSCPELGVAVSPGDIVIDAGGCFGDTALYFAHKVSSGGEVHTFEFVPSNLKILRRNLELNPGLTSRVLVAQFPIWSRSGLEMFILDKGPASIVSPSHIHGALDLSVKTITVDDYVIQSGVDRVSFIKMDIEGAEFDALIGASETIKKFKPKLAVCVYHSPDDFVRLARFIDSLQLGYRFALRHFTIHGGETVLFANPS